ncbi:rod shape-determining protein MreC [Rurimicrobium arvi]|uniref:Cell shape-determining protein MreC n=1 Tax=Rurimicrobium arvi TaxID=2049916 RepID=A0ABP8MGV9_9BACT
MRVLISFIQRFFNLILFLGLEILCVIMIARTNNLQGNDIMNSANITVAYWYQKQSGVSNYFALRQVNDSLLSENARLRQELARMGEVDTLKDSAVVHPVVEIKDSVKLVQYAHYYYYKARVVNNSIGAASNFITINRGYKDGIAPNMALVSGTGVVGRVVNTSAHFATALSILNTKQRLSAKLKDGTTSFVYWEQASGPDEMLMKVVQPEIKIHKGDSILTTSYSTVFPADMLIGTVKQVYILKKDNSRILHIRPATNFRNIQYVYAIKNEFIEERRRLEDSTVKADNRQKK